MNIETDLALSLLNPITAQKTVLSMGLFNNGFAVLTRGDRDPLVGLNINEYDK